MFTLKSYTLVLASLFSIGCITVTDADVHFGCTAWTNNTWNDNVRFSLNHNDPRSCPINANYGQVASTGSIVKDLTAVWPDNIGVAINLGVRVTSYATNPPTQEFESCAIGFLGSAFESFNWIPIPENPTRRERVAQAFVSYTVNDNPDYACFTVDLRSTIARARARIDLNYFGNQPRVATGSL